MKTTEKKTLLGAVVFFVLVLLVINLPQVFQGEKKVLGTSSNQTASQTERQAEVNGELIIEDTLVGTGAQVKSGDTIKIHYHGTLEDGTVFDSSVERDTPFESTIGVGQLIQGWDQGIPGMKVGGKRRLVIPPNLGYGSRSLPNIPPNSTLIFDVELLEIL